MALGRGFGKRNRNPWVAIPRSILIAFVMSKIVGFFAPEAEPQDVAPRLIEAVERAGDITENLRFLFFSSRSLSPIYFLFFRCNATGEFR